MAHVKGIPLSFYITLHLTLYFLFFQSPLCYFFLFVYNFQYFTMSIYVILTLVTCTLLLLFLHVCCVLMICLKFFQHFYLFIDINQCSTHEVILHTSYTFHILLMKYCVEFTKSCQYSLHLVRCNLLVISALYNYFDHNHYFLWNTLLRKMF